ncbi:peptidylprolyl isomerase [Cyclobacterium plantarum]|uniref:Peptidyl-prolyl cis-trans isomerase n=1 Tax=Cyclobacterium plantarum TaxID=2716263 RepID=A0ABX0H8S6_9BACT|nr:peptidylprolyl isomerase [Cyclobacterium plantarum]NHE56749.1 peptidylprolyl isomerase [Cyclobacterium plantarum]
MNKLACLTLILYFTFSFVNAQAEKRCQISTAFGSIIIELYPEKAPGTVTNFLKYVSNGAYVNSSFFRVYTPENESQRDIKIQVIQGGNVTEEQLLPPIPIETTRTTGILHEHGTISMARLGPDSAQSSFFICLGDQPELDYGGKRNPDGQGFAAFGKVVEGIDVVKQIQGLENKEQYLLEPVLIQEIRLLKQIH